MTVPTVSEPVFNHILNFTGNQRMLLLRTTMLRSLGSLFLLLSALLYFNPSLAYSLRNCTVPYSDDGGDVSVTCTGRDLTSVPGDIPKNVRSLDLSTNRILKVNRHDFSRLSKLISLQMVLNSVSHIDDRAFEDLVKLRDLDLRSNALTNLTDNMFQGLSSLHRLSLTSNQIKYISPLAFQPLVSLQTVELSYNELSQLTDIVPILQLPNLYSLQAGMNKFTSLESDELPFNSSSLRRLWFNVNPLRKFSITRDVFPCLEYLDLSKCSPGFEWDVTDGVFLRSLKSLFLSGTEVSFETYRTILQSAHAVEYLWLSYVKEWFDKGLINVACQMPALTYLDLTFNNIYILNNTLLQACSNITKLGLSGNVMSDLSEKSLRPLNQLEQLMLDHNFLPRVPRAVRGLSTLLVLNLASNDIGEVGCSDFLHLSSLLQLFLEDNRISILRGCALQDLKALTYLNIKVNPIFRVYDTFRVSLQNLCILDMNMNRFRGFSRGDFQGAHSLLTLDLKSVFDCSVENGTFEGLRRLKTLVLSSDSLNRDMFRGMPNLTSLTLYLPASGNSLGHHINDDSPFIYLPFLRSLTIYNSNQWFVVISANLLRGLRYLEDFATDTFFTETPHPDTFSHTPCLTDLKITSSHVSYLEPKLFEPIPNLQFLDLSKNRLRSLDFLTRAGLSALRWLKLTHNEVTAINETVLQSLPALTYLDLFGNPFTCDCLNVDFIQWVKNNNQTQVVNAYQYDCYFPPSKQGTRLLEFDIQSFYAFYLFLAFIYDSRKRKKGAPDVYDAFISYNVHDEAWVYREMIPVLEGEQGWRLCLHHRDFQPGKPIIENIVDAIYSSRKTICVISQRYLQSEWCSREIQMASFRLFDEQKDVLILLFLEEIPDQQLSPYHRMRKLVRRRTYLSWPQAGQHTGVFWQNIRRALETGNAPTDDTNLLTASLAPKN
uniref:toll-like receptor 13 n=1 Tax=Semicossyphus pulcher TaxID=241346 RepID=UPI0037E842B7